MANPLRGKAQSQPTPLQDWITRWTEFLDGALPAIFLVVVLLVGCVMIFMRRGYWPRKTILFGIGAAVAYLILTNVTNMAGLFQQELPLD